MRSSILSRFALLACVIVPACHGSAQDAPSAKSFLRSVYARYYRNGPGVEIAGSRANRYLHSSLIALTREDAKAVDGLGVLDGDPLCSCQDWDGIFDLKIDVHELKAGRAEASVSFALFKDAKPQDRRSLEITLAQEKGARRVFNVVDQSDPTAPFDLRKALEQEILGISKSKRGK
jgi:hypothetical protein